MIRISLLLALAALAAAPARAQRAPAQAQAALHAVSGGLVFAQNRGQWPTNVLFRARTRGADLWVTDEGVIYDFYAMEKADRVGYRLQDFLNFPVFDSYVRAREERDPRTPLVQVAPDREGPETTQRRGQVVAMHFEGAHARRVEGHVRQAAYQNYFLGNDPTHWASHVPVYDEVVLKDLYAGVDLRLYADGGLPRYDLVVAPGTDLAQVRMRLDGADNVSVTAAGTLRMETNLGPVEQRGLIAYQTGTGGTSEVIASAFQVSPDGTVGFVALDADPSRLLVIDPLVWSTFLGGTGVETALGLALGADGSTTVVGNTASSNFPTTPGAYDNLISGITDAFVARLSADGSTLVYSTFLGGSSGEVAQGVALGSDGSPTVVGSTSSSNFPTTPAAYDTTFNTGTGGDAFVARLSADGSTLIYSTFLGGTSGDTALGVALGPDASPTVVGNTSSSNFPATLFAFDTTYNSDTSSPGDAFVSQLSADGRDLLYSTFLGGIGGDKGDAVALGPDGSITVVGETFSSNFPTSPLAFDRSYNGGIYTGDTFVTHLDVGGRTLVYSTFLGGALDDSPYGGMAVGPDGSATVAGFTRSPDFPTTLGAYDTSHNGDNDVFVARFSADGSLLFSTFLGGTTIDTPHAIALDASGSATVVGSTQSLDYPTTPGAFDTTFNGGISDAFVSRISADGSALLYSTFIGGTAVDSANNIDTAYAVALGSDGSATLAGGTSASDFPTTPGAFDTTFNSADTFPIASDVFVTRLNFGANGSGCQLSFNKVRVTPRIVLPGTSYSIQVDIANAGPGKRRARLDLTFTRIRTGLVEHQFSIQDVFVPETGLKASYEEQLSPSAKGANYILAVDLVDTMTGLVCDTSSFHFSVFPGDPPPR